MDSGLLGLPGHQRPVHGRRRDGGGAVHCRGTNDGPLGPFPATGKEWTLPICEMWHFDADGRVVGGEIYYDQVSLLTQLGLLLEPSSV